MLLKRLISLFICVNFTALNIMPPAYAQALRGNDLAFLPEPGQLVPLSSAVNPPVLRGIKVFANDPLNFDFILDPGDKHRQDILDGKTLPKTDPVLRETSRRLLKYFLTTLTVPDTDIWVNLSPFEKDRVTSSSFGQTEMGRDILGQDYVLKEVTASLMSPESEVGKRFWARVYEEAQQRFGTTDIPVDTFNKVWIMPDKAVIYEKMGSDQAMAFVVESRLKVLLESDYFAMKGEVQEGSLTSAQELSRDVVREVIVPILEKEVNEGENFALLRQAYHSILLALWYKEKMQGSILSLAYIDRGKVAGVDVEDKAVAQKIWQRYVQAYKKGVVNIITEEKDVATDEIVPRKYFAGGFNLGDNAMANVKIIRTLGKYVGMLLLAGFLVISAGCTKEEQPISLYDSYFLSVAGPVSSTNAYLQTRIADNQKQIIALNQRLAGTTSVYDAYFSSNAGPMSTVIANLQAQNTVDQQQIARLNQRLTGTISAYDAYFSSNAGPISTVIANLQAQNTADQQQIARLNQRLTGTTSAYDAYFSSNAGPISGVIANLQVQNTADQEKIVALQKMISSGDYTNYLLSEDEIKTFIEGNKVAETENTSAIDYFNQQKAAATGNVATFLDQYVDYLDQNKLYLIANQDLLEAQLKEWGSTPPNKHKEIIEKWIVVLNQQIANNTTLSALMKMAATIIVPNYTNYLLKEDEIKTFIEGNQVAETENTAAIEYFKQQEVSAVGAVLAFLKQFVTYLEQNGSYLAANKTMLSNQLKQYEYASNPLFTPDQIIREWIAVLNQQVANNTTLSALMTTAATIIVPNYTNYLLDKDELKTFIDGNQVAETENTAAIQYFTEEETSASGAVLTFLKQFVTYLEQNGSYLTANKIMLSNQLKQYEYASKPLFTPDQIIKEWIAVLKQQIANNTVLSGLMKTAATINVSDYTNYLLKEDDIKTFMANNEKAVIDNDLAITLSAELAASPDGSVAAFFDQYGAYLKQNKLYLIANQALLEAQLKEWGPAPPKKHKEIIEQWIVVLNQQVANDKVLRDLMAKAVTIMLFDRAEKVGEKVERTPVQSINGGVDLTRSSTPLDVRNQGEAIYFKIDPAQVESISLARGLAPQVYAIAPLPSLSEFLK